MAHLQYMPGDPRLVDQLVYELKSKGIFDQFRKECIADVDTRPAYQNLRQRVESSVTTFLTRQTWKADLNKNQLREKLRKHILDGNYLEQGVERIVDQVVNPKVTSVFIPQVEDLVYNYLGIPRKKNPVPEVPETKDLHLEDLEAVSPGSVKSNDEESKEKVEDMDIDSEGKNDTETMNVDQKDELVEVSSDSASMDKSSIPLPSEEIKLENIPAPENSPTLAKVDLENIELPKEPSKPVNIELKNIELPKEPNLSTDIPLPDEVSTSDETTVFKPLALQSDESNSSSSSSIRRNMSPITPIRNFDDDSCDAQQAFENNSSDNNHKDPSSFTFNIENKDSIDSSEIKPPKKDSDLSYQFTNQVNINTYNTPMYDDSSNSHNLQIDYESDANTNTSKTAEVKQEAENNDESKKEKKDERKSSSHKSSHRSRDSSRHSSSKDKHSNSRDSSRHEKKTSSKDDKSKSSKEREKSKDRGDKKDSSSSKQRSSHKSSSSSSKDKHRSSNSSHRHSSKSSDDRKTSKDSKDKTSEKDKDRSSEKDRDRKESSSRDRKDSKSSHRDKDRKSSSRKDKDKKKDKKDTDDHYSSSGRGNHSRRSTDRDSNDGSSSSKGSQNQNNSKSTSDSKKESKNGSKSENTSTSTSETTSPSDKQQIVTNTMQFKPIIRVDKNLETPIANPPRLPFVPDVTLRKPKFANNFEEAKKMMKMRKFLAEEQKRMNQEAALLLEFQANVRPSMSQVYSSIPGPELEFACVTHTEEETKPPKETVETKKVVEPEVKIDTDTKFSLITVSDLIETKHVTKDIINDIIGVPIDDENSEVNEITITLELEELKEEPRQEIDDVKKFIKPTDKTVDPLEESIAEIVDQNMSTEVELTVSETLSEADVSDILETKEEVQIHKPLQYFAEHEKFTAELEKHKFGSFLKQYIENNDVSNKMYLMNCDTYEENIVKEIAATFGDYEIVNYHKNGHLVPNKNILHTSNEVSLPLETNEFDEKSPLFSPVKSECSFELSSDYDAKLNDMVNKKSRQEVMEIILGGMLDESTTKMPTIDYYTEMSDSENNLTIVEEPIEVEVDSSMKRRISEEVDENKEVFIPNKMRKISDSDQISSTTEETEEISNNNKIQTMRSKYLGRAKRVGLPRPKKCTQPNSPSSDKSVENYVQNTPTANGKLKTPRSKVQRYDTSDLYKPKLHYLSRRNNIS